MYQYTINFNYKEPVKDWKKNVLVEQMSKKKNMSNKNQIW